MDLTQFVTVIQDKSATLVLALVSLWMLNKSWQDKASLEKRYNDELRAIHENVIKALDNNTKALTTLLERWK